MSIKQTSNKKQKTAPILHSRSKSSIEKSAEVMKKPVNKDKKMLDNL